MFQISKNYQCLALDIGGVISADTWEAVLLTPEIGLAAYHNLDYHMVEQEAKRLWQIYACESRTEDEYWDDWKRVLGFAFDREQINKLYKDVLWADQTARDVIVACQSQGMKIAFVSNSTQFWFPMQMRMLGLKNELPSIMQFLSHKLGYRKTHAHGGLVKLAEQIDPKTILFVDDRKDNIEAAQKLGMTAYLYDHTQYNLSDFLLNQIS